MERRWPPPSRRLVRGPGGRGQPTLLTRSPGEPGNEHAAAERRAEGVGASGSGKGGATSNSTLEGARSRNREQRRRRPQRGAQGMSPRKRPVCGREDRSPRKHGAVTRRDTSWGHIPLRGARQVSPVTAKFPKLARRWSGSIVTRRESRSPPGVPAFVSGGQGGGGPARGPGAKRARAS